MTKQSNNNIKILFICHGNICRSPLAEYLLRHLVQTRGLSGSFHIASAATSREEIGNPVHRGTRAKLQALGISTAGKCAVRLEKQDYGKYDYLIGLSETLPAIAPEHRTERYLIEGCQSRVWVDAKLEDGRVYYAADSDAIITKGIIALLIRVLNGRTPQEILDTELYFIDAIGLAANLSPTRANGLAAMVKQMRLYALAFQAKSNS